MKGRVAKLLFAVAIACALVLAISPVAAPQLKGSEYVSSIGFTPEAMVLTPESRWVTVVIRNRTTSDIRSIEWLYDPWIGINGTLPTSLAKGASARVNVGLQGAPNNPLPLSRLIAEHVKGYPTVHWGALVAIPGDGTAPNALSIFAFQR